MIFREAKKFRIPFGQYQGMKIDSIAETDSGLKYLDWLRGNVDGRSKLVKEALDSYFSDPTIKEELNRLIYNEDPND